MYKLFDEKYETLSEAETALMDWVEDSVDEYIDDMEGNKVHICGEDYMPSAVLRKFDPAGYRIVKSELFDLCYGEIEEI